MIKIGAFFSILGVLLLSLWFVLTHITEKWQIIIVEFLVLFGVIALSDIITELIFLNLGVKG